MVGINLVVGRHGFGDGARSGPHLKEITRYFLPCSDLSKGAVNDGIKVDFQGFLFGFE
jgi:hypothetical protein